MQDCTVCIISLTLSFLLCTAKQCQVGSLWIQHVPVFLRAELQALQAPAQLPGRPATQLRDHMSCLRLLASLLLVKGAHIYHKSTVSSPAS